MSADAYPTIFSQDVIFVIATDRYPTSISIKLLQRV